MSTKLVDHQIRVQGHLDSMLTDWFAPLKVINEPTGEALLRGQLHDQVELLGLLLKLHDLNFAAVGIFFHHPLGNYIGWFMMIYAVIGGLLLLTWPLLAGQMQYLPGMMSAPLSILMGLIGINRLSKKTEIQGVLS
jgi:hypothetical protein